MKKTTKPTTAQKVKRAILGPKYTIEAIINGETYELKTDDIEEAIMSIKPDLVLLESYFTVTAKGVSNMRRLDLYKTRRLFNDTTFREVFISTLIFE